MKSLRALQLLALAAVVMFAGCSGDAPTSVDSGVDVSAPFYTVNTVECAGYELTFVGRTYSAGVTAFEYSFAQTISASFPSYFELDVPDCAGTIDSYDPGWGSVVIDSLTGDRSIIWSNEVPLATSGGYLQSYTVSFVGDVPMGTIGAAWNVDKTDCAVDIPGPCDNRYLISGSVYIDADDSQTRGPSESGVGNVTVRLTDKNGTMVTDTTDADGNYSFARVEGDYVISLASSTTENDFNESLFANFDATTSTAIPVTIGPDNSGNDFGFNAKVEDISAKVENGELVTFGRSVKYWRKTLQLALIKAEKKKEWAEGEGQQVDFTATELIGFLSEIEGLYLTDPYKFNHPNKIVAALEILAPEPNTDDADLARELLATELNFVAGFGLGSDPGLLGALISWGETILYEAWNPSAAAIAPSTEAPLTKSKEGTEGPQRALTGTGDSAKMFNLLNGATGGGGGGEG